MMTVTPMMVMVVLVHEQLKMVIVELEEMLIIQTLVLQSEEMDIKLVLNSVTMAIRPLEMVVICTAY